MAKEKETRGWGDCCDEILKLRTAKQGKLWLAKELRRLRKEKKDWKKLSYAGAKKIFLGNIGYFSGYYGPRQARKIQQTIATSHPVFGRI